MRAALTDAPVVLLGELLGVCVSETSLLHIVRKAADERGAQGECPETEDRHDHHAPKGHTLDAEVQRCHERKEGRDERQSEQHHRHCVELLGVRARAGNQVPRRRDQVSEPVEGEHDDRVRDQREDSDAVEVAEIEENRHWDTPWCEMKCRVNT